MAYGGGGHYSTVYARSGGGFFRRLLASVAAPAPTPKPEPPAVDQLLQRLMVETPARQPVPAAATGSAGLVTLLRKPRPGPIKRDWNEVVCFFLRQGRP